MAASGIINIKTKVDDADNKKKPVLSRGKCTDIMTFSYSHSDFLPMYLLTHRLRVLKRDKSTYFQSQLCLLPKLHSSFLNNENRS